MPTAERAWRPGSPNTSTSRSEHPLITLGWSEKWGSALTMPSSLITASSGIHDRDPVGRLGDHPEIVGDEHQGSALAPEVSEDVEDLRLRGHVESRRGLVRDDEVGLAGDRHRDHDALAHPARHLVRLVVETPLWVGNAHAREQPLDGGARRLSREAWRSEDVGASARAASSRAGPTLSLAARRICGEPRNVSVVEMPAGPPIGPKSPFRVPL
jgi:hypothetical protein